MNALKVNFTAVSSVTGEAPIVARGQLVPVVRETPCFWWVVNPTTGEEKRVSKETMSAHMGGTFVAFAF